MKTLPQFIEKHPMIFSYVGGVKNPLMGENMRHYAVKILYRGKTARFLYSKGMGHNGTPPTLCEVLFCLASDASCDSDFNGFCSEFGYSDARKAVKIYIACQKNRVKLLRIFGEETFEELIYNTERE